MKRLTGPVSSIEMPLLCGLGRHKIDRLARWNDGYYFAKCKRCGHDLVRTAYEGWSIPQGFRVVWQAEAPRHARFAQVVPDDADVPAEILADVYADANGSAIEFPIREREDDAAERVPADAGPRATHDEDEGMGAEQFEFAEREAAEHLAGGAARRDMSGGSDDDREAEFGSDPAGADSFMFVAQPTEPPAAVPESDAAAPLDREQTDAAEPTPADGEEGGDEPLGTEATGTPSDDGQADDGELAAMAASDAPSAEGQSGDTDPAGAEPAPAPEPPAKRYPFIPDFMDENPVAPVYDRNTGEIIARAPLPGERAVDERREEAKFLSTGWRNLVRQKAEIPGDAMSPFLRRRRREAKVRVDGPPLARRVGRFFYDQKEIAAAALFGGLVLAAAIVDGRNAPAPSEERSVASIRSDALVPVPARRTRPAPRVVAIAGGPVQANDLAFVTASILNCRAEPSNDSATVRKLERGAEVQVLGIDPGWLRVSHRGAQCWASLEHLATSRPS